MKKTYLLEELDCANCAAKIENEVRGMQGVISANLNFMSQKLVVEMEDSIIGTAFDSIKKIVKKFEPDVDVTERA